jgi:hypothetical protein
MDFLAATFALIGVYLIGSKSRWGWLCCLCSGITWMIVAYQTKVWGLYLEVIPLIFLNVRGFIKWSKE